MQKDRPETDSAREEHDREDQRERQATGYTESEKEEIEREHERFDESGLGPPDPGHN
jgi:hypothetical protein